MSINELLRLIDLVKCRAVELRGCDSWNEDVAALRRGIVALGEERDRERQRYEDMRAEYGKLEDAAVAWMERAKDRDALRAENARLTRRNEYLEKWSASTVRPAPTTPPPAQGAANPNPNK